MSNEPVLLWGTVGTLIGSLLAWLVPDMPNDVVQNIVTLVGLLGPILISLFYARSQVDGPRTAEAKDAEIEQLKAVR